MSFIDRQIRRSATMLALALFALIAGISAAGLAIAAFCVAMSGIYGLWQALLLTAGLALVLAGAGFLMLRFTQRPSPQQQDKGFSADSIPAPVLTLLTSEGLRLLRRRPKTVLGSAAALGIAAGLFLSGSDRSEER